MVVHLAGWSMHGSKAVWLFPPALWTPDNVALRSNAVGPLRQVFPPALSSLGWRSNVERRETLSPAQMFCQFSGKKNVLSTISYYSLSYASREEKKVSREKKIKDPYSWGSKHNVLDCLYPEQGPPPGQHRSFLMVILYLWPPNHVWNLGTTGEKHIPCPLGSAR